ncbi:hypothetical protein CPC08DRAFT_259937 [Agrocybe pediades]|nr:hypothetical protein CPC08DRAFT_259937 [Agrocybe pediades]
MYAGLPCTTYPLILSGYRYIYGTFSRYLCGRRARRRSVTDWAPPAERQRVEDTLRGDGEHCFALGRSSFVQSAGGYSE